MIPLVLRVQHLAGRWKFFLSPFASPPGWLLLPLGRAGRPRLRARRRPSRFRILTATVISNMLVESQTPLGQADGGAARWCCSSLRTSTSGLTCKLTPKRAASCGSTSIGARTPAGSSSAYAPSEQRQRGSRDTAGDHDGEAHRRCGERAGGEQDHQAFRIEKVAGILPVHDVGMDKIPGDTAKEKQQRASSPPGLRVLAQT